MFERKDGSAPFLLFGLSAFFFSLDLFQALPLIRSIIRAAFKSLFNQPPVHPPKILQKIDMLELHPSSGLPLWRCAEFAFQGRARDFREVGSRQMLMIKEEQKR